MKLALIAAVAAIGMGAPASAAVTYTLNIDPQTHGNVAGSGAFSFTTPNFIQSNLALVPTAQFDSCNATPSFGECKYGSFITSNVGYDFVEFGTTFYGIDVVFEDGVFEQLGTHIAITDGIRGVWAGTLTVSESTGPVPEPTTWAMMIGGFGVIGGAMRYRRRKVSVSFT